MSDKVSLQVPITKDLHKQLRHEAIASDKTVRQWVVEAIAEKAHREGKQRHGHQGD